MINNLKVMLVISLFLSFFISCTEDMEPVLPDEPAVEVPQPDDENNNAEDKPGNGGNSNDSSNNNQNNQDAYEIGNGSGNLIIDGNSTALTGKKLIVIKGGTYGSITIKNINANQGNPVFVKNGGQVLIKDAMYTENITNVTIAGDNVSGMQYGFNFHDIPYRAIILAGKMSGVTLKNLSFKNVNDFVIFSGSTMNYLGTAETRTDQFKVLNCLFDNAAGVYFSGNLDSREDTGFIKDLEFAYNTIQNSDNAGNFANFGNVQDYDIHHNEVNNLNANNNNHNGVFHMIGNGKLHNNKFTNYQGNAIRAWVFSRGSDPATVEIYDNIVYNTRKYGAFEIQGFDRYIISGKTTYVNAKVYNNTAGKLNTQEEWVGVILDLYNYGGTLEFYNNLGFNLKRNENWIDVPVTNANMINNYSSAPIIRNTNNRYFPAATEAVTDLINFKSKVSGVGATL